MYGKSPSIPRHINTRRRTGSQSSLRSRTLQQNWCLCFPLTFFGTKTKTQMGTPLQHFERLVVSDDAGMSIASSPDSTLSESYADSSSGDYDSTGDWLSSYSGDESDHQSVESPYEWDSDSSFGTRSNNNPCSDRKALEVSSRSNVAYVASVLCAQGGESPVTAVLQARHGNIPQERIFHRRSRPFDEIPRRTLVQLDRWQDTSSRSHEELPRGGSFDNVQSCASCWLERRCMDQSTLRLGKGGNSFFLNMFTASSTNQEALMSVPPMDLNKSVGLGPTTGRNNHCLAADRPLTLHKPSEGFLPANFRRSIPSQSSNAATDEQGLLPHEMRVPSQDLRMIPRFSGSEVTLGPADVRSDSSGLSSLSQHSELKKTSLPVRRRTPELAQPVIASRRRRLRELHQERIGPVHDDPSIQSRDGISCSFPSDDSSNFSKGSVSGRVNRKWRECLGRSRSLRSVS